MIRVGIIVTALLLVGCTSRVQVSTKSSPPSSAPADSTPESPSSPSNRHVCIEANVYIIDHLQATFARIAANAADIRAAGQLRTESAHLYRLSTSATGDPQRAIQRVANALTDVAVAVQARDTAGVAQAATRANSALVAFRGVCNV